MKLLVKILLGLLLLSGCVKAQTGILGFRVDGNISYTGNIYFMGNSITIGYPLADENDRFSTRLCVMLGATEINHGISSSTLEKRSPIDPICCGTNMLDNIPTKTSGDDLLIFMFGMNDWGYNGINYEATNYMADYTTVVNDAVSKGWPLSRIVLLSPTYPTDNAFDFYDAINGLNPAPDRTGIQSFVSATETIAITLGVKYLDLYHPIENDNPSILIGSDGVHPVVLGHQFIASRIYNFLIQ